LTRFVVVIDNAKTTRDENEIAEERLDESTERSVAKAENE
jgi:hypothetical protein